MSDSKLLAENTIRRFMKLANVDTMTDNFISEMGYGKKGKKEDLEEETVEETNEDLNEEEEAELEEGGMRYKKGKPELEEQAEDELEVDMGETEPEAEAEPDLEMDAEPEAEMGAADMSLTEEEAQLIIDLGKRLEEAMAGEVDAEPAMDAPADDMDDMGDMDPEPEEEDPMMQENLVQEVLKRVTSRLVQAKLKNRK